MPNNHFFDYSGELIDDYQVERLLVRHKVNTLYLARNKSGMPVLVEILNSTAEQEPELNGRFQQQVDTLMQHRHPGIAELLHVGRTGNDHAYAVSQYSAGATLAQNLSEWRKTGLTFPVLGALQLVKHLAQALAVAHSLGIFHHDLRPEHIVLDKNNVLVLTGLGVPYQAEPPLPIKQVEMLDYLSPEQQQGKPINGRSNIYSLGIILYELLAGHRPKIPITAWDIFELTTLPKAIPLEEARTGLSAETYTLVNTCLWRQEWYRYETMDQFVTAVDTAIAAETAQANRRSRIGGIPRWLYAAVPVALLVLVLAGLLLAQGNAGAGEATPLPVTAVATPSVENQPTPAKQVVIPTTIPTAEPAGPTATMSPEFILLNPSPEVGFTGDETVEFDWSYPASLSPGQQFSVQIKTENGAQTLGAIAEPVSGRQYRLAIELAGYELNPGAYSWYIVLETTADGQELLRSEERSFLIQPILPTATPSLTATPVITPTQQPTVTPTVCAPTPPPGWVTYIVQEGDYLYNLALATGTTVERLQEVNCLADAGLGIGKLLWLPALPPTATPTPTLTAVATAVPSNDNSGSNSPRVTRTPPPPPPP